MQMTLCPSGRHYYDAALHSQCPYCSGPQDVGVTQAVPRPLRPDAASAPIPGVTQAVIKKKLGIDPVVGWLVCIEGPDKGTDYRLHADNNYIGRDPSMDVCIAGDDTVTRERHALLTYDFETKTFYVAPTGGKKNPRLNGKPVLNALELSPYDRIQVGETTLLFIPLCSERFEWR